MKEGFKNKEEIMEIIEDDSREFLLISIPKELKDKEVFIFNQSSRLHSVFQVFIMYLLSLGVSKIELTKLFLELLSNEVSKKIEEDEDLKNIYISNTHIKTEA